MSDFDHYYPKSDQASFHDMLYDLFGESFDTIQEAKYFKELPDSVKFIAYEWGLSDTCFRDAAWTFLKEKYNL
jgi:hypothetical protein